MGFGHRVYKNYDPRARIIRKHLDDVFEVRGKSPLLEVATELEKRALDDDYFTSRKLYPNVDFYSGLIYEALGLPVAMFPVMFAIGRTSGWIAQWLEMVEDSEQKIARPRQIYTGERDRDYVADRAARLGFPLRARASRRCVAASRGPRGSAGQRRSSSAQKRGEWSRISRWQTSCQIDVFEHRLGRQQQPPVEAHPPARRAGGPAGALGADVERAVAGARRAPWHGPGARRPRRGRRACRSARAPAARRRPARAVARRCDARACAPPAARARAGGRGRAPCRRARRSARACPGPRRGVARSTGAAR